MRNLKIKLSIYNVSDISVWRRSELITQAPDHMRKLWRGMYLQSEDGFCWFGPEAQNRFSANTVV